MTTPRGSLVWLAMVVAGLSLGAYVFVAWPDSSSPAKPVHATASVSYPESELVGDVAGAFYPGSFYGYSFEPGTTPALDAVISAPQALGAG